MTGTFDGEAAIVTGASSGIGRATALHFGTEGASVALAARREERLEAVADEIAGTEGRAEVVPTDVSEENQVESLVAETVEAFGRLDVVVSNAGTATRDPVENVATDDYRSLMGVNVDGSFFLTRAAIPHLRETEGNLVFVGSYASTVPFPRNPLYGASKRWLTAFAQGLQGQVGDEGIGVTVVNPSEVRTEIGKEYREPNRERFDPGQVIEPEEVAEAIAFAARQETPTTVTELNLFRRSKFANLGQRSEFPD